MIPGDWLGDPFRRWRSSPPVLKWAGFIGGYISSQGKTTAAEALPSFRYNLLHGLQSYLKTLRCSVSGANPLGQILSESRWIGWRKMTWM
jgi:hypothetical protein